MALEKSVGNQLGGQVRAAAAETEALDRLEKSSAVLADTLDSGFPR
jgi:hypothetical protein